MNDNRAFVYFLESEGIIDEYETIKILDRQSEEPFALLQHLVEKGVSDKKTLAKLWGDSMNIAFVELDNFLFQPDVVHLLPEKDARKLTVIPLYQYGALVTVATADPMNTELLETVGDIIGIPVSPVFALPEDIQDTIDIQYQGKDLIDRYLKEIPESVFRKDLSGADPGALEELSLKKWVARPVHALFLLAIKHGASGLDLVRNSKEPFFTVFFRIKGVLENRFSMPADFFPLFSCRIKSMASLDQAATHSQHGRLVVRMAGKTLGIHISTWPHSRGETLSLRFTREIRERDIANPADWYMARGIHEKLCRLMKRKRGIFFLTGPPGSGRHAVIHWLLREFFNRTRVFNLNEPQEYNMKGVRQTMTAAPFSSVAAALLAMEKAEPSVLLADEIGDSETAKAALRAVVAGHMVISVTTEEDALKLLVLAASWEKKMPGGIIGILAQQNLRTICDTCKKGRYLSEKEMGLFFRNGAEKPVRVYDSQGCPDCGGTGFSGGIPAQELLVCNREIRDAASAENSLSAVSEAAKKSGFAPMDHDGMKKVLRGLTSLDEWMKVFEPEKQ